jgi:DNA-binding NarL/FixJ family response regulator
VRRDYVRAVELLEEALSLARQLGDASQVAYALHSLGHIAWARSDLKLATALLTQSMSVSTELGDRRGIAACLQSMALVAGASKSPARTARLSGAAAGLRAAGGLGAHGRLWLRTDHGRGVDAARAALGDAVFAAEWAAGETLTVDDAVVEALASAELPDRTSSNGDRELECLTRREREVAQLVVMGLTNRQIGEALVITEGTASLHVKHALGKLGLRSRAQLAALVSARTTH